VAFDGADQGELLVLRQRAQGRSERRLQGAAVDLELQGWSETECERVAAGNPAQAAPEQARDRNEGQSVLAQ